MAKNPKNFSPDDVKRMAESPAGQALIRMLRQQNGDTVRNATDQWNAGNYEQAGQTLRSLMQDPEVQKLLRDLED